MLIACRALFDPLDKTQRIIFIHFIIVNIYIYNNIVAVALLMTDSSDVEIIEQFPEMI